MRSHHYKAEKTNTSTTMTSSDDKVSSSLLPSSCWQPRKQPRRTLNVLFFFVSCCLICGLLFVLRRYTNNNHNISTTIPAVATFATPTGTTTPQPIETASSSAFPSKTVDGALIGTREISGSGSGAGEAPETTTSQPSETSSSDKNNNDSSRSPHASSSPSSPVWLKKYAAESGPGVVNVHVVPHTHDDVGWRKTVEQYYFGWNETLEVRGRVHAILSTSLAALLLQSHRTMTYVESKFWHLWWTQTATMEQRQALRQLVQPPTMTTSSSDESSPSSSSSSSSLFPQWTFVNGGWSMHDEACTHFMGMVDSTTLGHDWLRQELGVIPTIGWQLDPFGHSATQARWLTHALGFHALYFGRIDHQELQHLSATQTCDGLWNPDWSGGDEDNDEDGDDDDAVDPTVFWSLTGSFHGNYGPPSNDYCFDRPTCSADLLSLDETELHAKLQTFLELLALQVQQSSSSFTTATNGNYDILLTMGDDFTYSHAEVYFANLDYLMGQLMWGQANHAWNITDIFRNASTTTNTQTIQRVNIFYSSPEYYTERKYQQYQQQLEQEQEQEQEQQRVLEKQNQHPITKQDLHPTKQQRAPQKDRTSADQERNSETGQQETAATAKAQQQHQQQRRRTTTTRRRVIKTDDFFPYSDCPHCFWTGYFTSRTAFKRFERVASGFLQAARQLEFWNRWTTAAASSTTTRTTTTTTTTRNPAASSPSLPPPSPPLFALEDALGVAQHHDAITGTGKQHVANDYSRRLQAGLDQAASYVESWVQAQLYLPHATAQLRYCGQLNESLCEPATDADFVSKQGLYVVIYNPLAQTRGWRVQLPVSVHGTFVVERVVDAEEEKPNPAAARGGKPFATRQSNDPHHQEQHQPQVVVSRRVPFSTQATASSSSTCESTDRASAMYQIEFYASDLIPLGAVTYRIFLQQQQQQQPEKEVEEDLHGNKDDASWQSIRQTAGRTLDAESRARSNPFPKSLVTFQDDIVRASNGQGLVVWFDRHSGQLERVSTDHGATSMALQIDWGYYLPYDHAIDHSDDGRENSGAYIFRPSTPNATLMPVFPLSSSSSSPPRFVTTEHGVEVHTTYTDDDDDENNKSSSNSGVPFSNSSGWIQQIVRIWKHQPWIEVEYTVGPIPLGADASSHDKLLRGKEVVSRIVASDISNHGIFYTDSNGRMFMKRQRNFRPTYDIQVYEPVAGNYYPVTTALYIQDERRTEQGSPLPHNTRKDCTATLGLVTDRARGGGSIVDGSIEVMVHRRTLVDDHRGVDEPMNETCGGQIEPYPPYGNARRIGQGSIVSGIHRIVVGCHDNQHSDEDSSNNNHNNSGHAAKSSSSRTRQTSGAQGPRSIMDQIFAQPLLFVAPATIHTEDKNTFASPVSTTTNPSDDTKLRHAVKQPQGDPPQQKSTFSVLGGNELPHNVFLMTLAVRHEYGGGNHSTGTSTTTTTTTSPTTSMRLLVRLAHQYGRDEDPLWSKPVPVNVSALFPFKILSMVETTLSGNQNWTDFVAHKKYNWTKTTTTRTTTPSAMRHSTKTTAFRDENSLAAARRIQGGTRDWNDEIHQHESQNQSHVPDSSLRQFEKRKRASGSSHMEEDTSRIVTLRPLEIRTFEIRVDPSL